MQKGKLSYMDALERLTRRASVRRYRPDPIPEADIDRMLAAAQQAPTDASGQLYTILRVRDRGLRERLAHLAGDQRHVVEAAEFFVLLADLYRIERLLAHRGSSPGRFPRMGLHFALVDATLAGAHLAVAAEQLGYGICWIGGLLNRADEVARLLDLPPGVLPVSGLTVGVPDENPAPRPRLPRALVVHTDRYRRYGADDLEAAYRAMAPISKTGDWLKLLAHYFASGGAMEARDPIYGRTKARQGFADDLDASAAEALFVRDVDAGSLAEAITDLLKKGWRGVLFGQGAFGESEVWIERETEAHRGEGRHPGDAVAEAVKAAYPDEG